MARTAKRQGEWKEGLQAASTLALSKRRGLFACIGALAAICCCLDYFAPISGNRIFYSDVITVASAGLAFGVSIQIILRQKLNGTFPRLFGFLAFGLGLWFVAEAIWDYYEIGIGIDTPFPSIADPVWLAGYIPFFGFVLGMHRSFPRDPKLRKKVAVISAAAIALVAYPIITIYQQSDLSNFDGIVKYVISILYPVSDIFLLVPVALIFIRLRSGTFTFTPWAYLVIAIMLSIVGDIGFGLFTAKGGLDNIIWIWNPFYQVEYLAIACSLIWHKSFFTVNAKKILNAWQEANR